MKNKPFVANMKNQQKFINLLALEIQKGNAIDVNHAAGDVAYDIVSSACNIAQ